MAQQTALQLKFEMIGTFLRQKRKEAGLTQGEVAKELGYTSPQFISNYERGLCAPAFDAYPRLMNMYKIPKEDMLQLLLKSEEVALRKKLFGS